MDGIKDRIGALEDEYGIDPVEQQGDVNEYWEDIVGAALIEADEYTAGLGEDTYFDGSSCGIGGCSSTDPGYRLVAGTLTGTASAVTGANAAGYLPEVANMDPSGIANTSLWGLASLLMASLAIQHFGEFKEGRALTKERDAWYDVVEHAEAAMLSPDQ